MLGHSVWVRNRSITSRSEVCTQVMKKTQLSLQSSTCKNKLFYWFVEYLSIRFPPAATSFILQQFSQYGNIVRSVVSLPFLSLTKTIMHAWFETLSWVCITLSNSSTPLLFISGYAKMENVFCCLKQSFECMHNYCIEDAFVIHPKKTWFDSCLVSNEYNRLKRLYDSRAESWILIVLKVVCIPFKWEYYQSCLLIYLVMFFNHQTSKGNWMHIQFQSKLQAKKVSSP